MGKVKVVIPSLLASFTGGEKIVELNAANLKEALGELVSKYGESLKDKILDASGKPRRFLNIYVNGKNVYYLGGVDTPLKDGDEVSILLAISGG